MTALQEKNSNLILATEENDRQLQDLQKTLQKQKSAELISQQRINELTIANQQLVEEISSLVNNPATPQILQEKQQLELQLKAAVDNYQEIKAELSRKEGYLECLLSFNKNEKSEVKQKLQQETESLKKRLFEAEQDKKKVEEQLTETKEKLAESKGKLEAKQEEIIRMGEVSGRSPSGQEENKLIACTKKLQTIQEDLNLFFNGWNNLPFEQQERLITELEVTKKDTRVGWISENNMFTLTNRVNKAITFIGGGLSTFGSAKIGGGITLVSSAVDTVVSEIENEKKKKQEKLIKFLQDFANLERNYQDLRKISTYLTSINKNTPLSETANQALITFSQLVNELQESINLYNSDISRAEQGVNEAQNKHFIHHLQKKPGWN
ncbi:MAG: hypothetical protein MRECE_22c023 [Mycoplasmataceae bacterium CE_OT135]|nr:MAG: hypothetical protein MRECE_22c023 [Mycoplasmataceae bacterium CE_OT135]